MSEFVRIDSTQVTELVTQHGTRIILDWKYDRWMRITASDSINQNSADGMWQRLRGISSTSRAGWGSLEVEIGAPAIILLSMSEYWTTTPVVSVSTLERAQLPKATAWNTSAIFDLVVGAAGEPATESEADGILGGISELVSLSFDVNAEGVAAWLQESDEARRLIALSREESRNALLAEAAKAWKVPNAA